MSIGSLVAYLSSRNPWQHINNNAEWAKNPALDLISAETYQLIKMVGFGLIALSMVFLYLKWALYRKEEGALNRRNTIVGPLILKLFLVLLISCLPYLIGEVFRIVNMIAKSIVA